MNTLVVYDNEGYVLLVRSGEPTPREPVGVPFLWVDIPEGKYVESVDISVTPHRAVLKDRPPTEIEQLRKEMARTNTELFETMLMLTGGM